MQQQQQQRSCSYWGMLSCHGGYLNILLMTAVISAPRQSVIAPIAWLAAAPSSCSAASPHQEPIRPAAVNTKSGQ
jgi:hypothetical protein